MKDETLSGNDLSGSITIPAGGACIAAGCNYVFSGTGTMAWTGPTEDLDINVDGAGTCFSTAHKTSVAGESLSITATTVSPFGGSLAAVAFG